MTSLMDKPVGNPVEAAWLGPDEAALLLESAKTYRPGGPFGLSSPIYPLIACFLLTGGRRAEVLGLEVDDISFNRQTVTFRPNKWRRLKTKKSHRSVPLWPQLKDILEQYFADRERGGGLGDLVFPSAARGPECMIRDFRYALDKVALRAGWKLGEVRSKSFRHTYASARLQTLDGGSPVALFTVARELGHKSVDMVEGIYSHLGQIRHRSEVVEYRLSQHRKTIGKSRLGAWEQAVTAEAAKPLHQGGGGHLSNWRNHID